MFDIYMWIKRIKQVDICKQQKCLGLEGIFLGQNLFFFFFNECLGENLIVRV